MEAARHYVWSTRGNQFHPEFGFRSYANCPSLKLIFFYTGAPCTIIT